MSASDSAPPLLVEVGWEVCNRVGGIYTVLRTKVAEMVADWGDRYVLVGPLVPQSAQVEFEEEEPPEAIRAGVDALKAQGFDCVVGRWLVRGRPWTVLIDLRSLRPQIPRLRQQFIDDHGLYSERTDPLVGDVLAFGHGVRCFLNGLSSDSKSPPLALLFGPY